MKRTTEYFKCLTLSATITVECCGRNRTGPNKRKECRSCKKHLEWQQTLSVYADDVEGPVPQTLSNEPRVQASVTDPYPSYRTIPDQRRRIVLDNND